MGEGTIRHEVPGTNDDGDIDDPLDGLAFNDTPDPAAVARHEVLVECAEGTGDPPDHMDLPAVAGSFMRWVEVDGVRRARVDMPVPGQMAAIVLGTAVELGIDQGLQSPAQVRMTCTVLDRHVETTRIHLSPHLMVEGGRRTFTVWSVQVRGA